MDPHSDTPPPHPLHPTPVIALIVAMAENRVIGQNGGLPWRLPADLRRFKALTMGHHLLMGRKTYDSIGRPLPGRTSVVITRDQSFTAPGCVVVHSLNAALDVARRAGDSEVFIIGGGEIYREALPLADRIDLTRVAVQVKGDVVFPELDPATWAEVERTEHPADARNPHAYAFCRLVRRLPR